MSYTVTVAPLLPAHGLLNLDQPIGNQTEALRWDERIHVQLEVEDDETLWFVLQRAKPSFDLASSSIYGGAVPADPLPYGISFFKADDDPPKPRGSYFPQDLITVDQQGRAHWNRGLKDIPYGDLRRAAEAGLLDGDPLRPYFVLNYPQGGGFILGAWHVLKVVWEVLEGLIATYEVGKLTVEQSSHIRNALEGRSVANEFAEQWSDYGGGPREVRRLIERMPWTPADFRIAVGLETDDQAIVILELFGCVRNEDGAYWIKEDEETEILRIAEWAATDYRFRDFQDGDPEAAAALAEYINEHVEQERAIRDRLRADREQEDA